MADRGLGVVGDSSGESELLAEFDRLAHQAGLPAVGLDRFFDEYPHTDDDEHPVRDADFEALGVSQERIRDARRRWGALIHAANMVVQDCLDDHATQSWIDDEFDSDEADEGLNTADLEVSLMGASFVARFFPPRFRHAYDEEFFGKVLVTAVKVGYDLVHPEGGEPACIAEEIIINAICQIAVQTAEAAGLEPSWMDPTEFLLEDTDFEILFQSDMDGLEDDPAAQLDLRMWVPSVSGWFTPFNDDRIAHPFTQTTDEGPRAHDLGYLLTDEQIRNLAHDEGVTDDPAPIAGLDPISKIVELARTTASKDDDSLWVPEPLDPESSYSALVELTRQDQGSGWLTWEPHEGADAPRTDAVIRCRPRRHFPAGDDQPWVEIVVTRVVMYVPLAAVISYHPDPEVRHQWETAWNSLLKPRESE